MKIKINNYFYDFELGQTILDVAVENGISIPTLCYLKKTGYSGKCRVCVVEDINSEFLLTACNTPAKESYEIFTDSLRVINARRTVVDLILSSGNHECLSCDKNSACKLQDLAYELGIKTAGFTKNTSFEQIDNSSQFISFDRNKCISCGICVSACKNIVVNVVLDVSDRGLATRIIFDNDKEIAESSCVQCGECSQLCPVSAIYDKYASGKGRVWQLEKIKSICPYCGVGCGIIIHINLKHNKIVKITGDEDNSTNQGSLCVKGRYGFDFIQDSERLTEPLKKQTDGSFLPISWEDAICEISEKLKKFNSNQIAGFSSAKITNEENYLFQKFFRKYLKTNNIDHCARLCHASTVTGLSKTLGSGAMTNYIQDIVYAKLIFVIGSDTTETHPVISYWIKQAVINHNAKLIVVDPKRVKLADHAFIYAQLKPGFDVLLINSIMNVIVSNYSLDLDYLRNKNYHFDEFLAEIRLEKYKPENVEKYCGVSSDTISSIADYFVKLKPAKVFFAMGVTQHSTGTDNVASLANLQLLCDNIGLVGGGVNPLRGQVNVQGACDMAALPNFLPGYQKFENSDVFKSFENAWNCKLSDEPGLAMTEVFKDILSDSDAEQRIRALYIVGENPVISEPNQSKTIKALKDLDLLVVQDIFFNETARYADYILPAACFAEKDGHFTNTERKVQRIFKALNPPGQAKSDSDILQLFMKYFDSDYKVLSVSEINAEICSLVPLYRGITWERTVSEDLYWPCLDVTHSGTPILFLNDNNKKSFAVVDFKKPAECPDEEYPFILTTGRLLYQYHSMTMTGKTQGLNELGKPFAMLSVYDGERLNLRNNSIIVIESRRGKINIPVKLSKRIATGLIFIPFHFAKSAANVLTNDVLDLESKIPELKVCAVKIFKENN